MKNENDTEDNYEKQAHDNDEKKKVKMIKKRV
jgi:hypothetical protein